MQYSNSFSFNVKNCKASGKYNFFIFFRKNTILCLSFYLEIPNLPENIIKFPENTIKYSKLIVFFPLFYLKYFPNNYFYFISSFCIYFFIFVYLFNFPLLIYFYLSGCFPEAFLLILLFNFSYALIKIYGGFRNNTHACLTGN